MGIDKLLEKLTTYLERGESEDASIRCDQVNVLLEKLEKKEDKLRNKVDKEKSKSKKKKLKLELRIVAMERKKSIKRRDELKDKCK